MMVPNAAVGGLPVRGPIPTLYDGNRGPNRAFADALTLLKRARPEAIQVHSWEIESAARTIRLTFKDKPIIAGFGVDGIARKVSAGQITPEQAAEEFVKLADSASRAKCIAVMWNGEQAYKAAKGSETAAKIARAVRLGLAAVKAKYPDLIQLHTAYDHPSYHSEYPWPAWIGAGSPITASAPQVYAAGTGAVQAHRGALGAREAKALSSWRAAVRAGWIKEDVAAGEEGDLVDVDWLPYVQLHGVNPADTAALLAEYPVTFGWALVSRADQDGMEAFTVACGLHRLGFHGPNAGLDFQRSTPDLAQDNVIGKMTRAAVLSRLDALNREEDAAAKSLA